MLKPLSRPLVLAATLVGFAIPAFAADTPNPTFSKDVAPILQARCQDCHRPGSIGPMSLLTFQDARPWARAIKERVSARQMPPWHINTTVGIQKFANDMSLTDAQIDTIVRWVDSGAPQGDPKDMPAPKVFPADGEWQAAKMFGRPPDLVITSDPYTMAAHRQDAWWRPVNDIPITTPRWARAVEMRPVGANARKIVHHAVAYLDQQDPDTADVPGAANEERRGMLMEWAVGKEYDIYRADSGKLLLPGSKISWDQHLHAEGEEITEAVQLGIWLYPEGQQPKYRTYLTAVSALKNGLDIPPNSVVQTEGFMVLKKPARLENVQPHMHLRGKAMELEAILPDGKREVVSLVDRFNFNWMTNYIYSDEGAPMYPQGTVLHVIAWYDNTTGNKNNPDPNQWVGNGSRTVDEMGHLWVNITYVSEADYTAWAAAHKKTSNTTNNQ